MSLKSLFLLSTLLPLILAFPSQMPLSSCSDKDQYAPSISSARSNANFIFNTVHSAMRQWGSSLQHNGMSIFPASVPEGTMLYHGTHQAGRIVGIEWLAFEMEHAEIFANGRRLGPGRGERPGEPGGPGGPPHMNDEDHTIPDDDLGGYLHMYRANRPLSLLYIDGMSAGKSSLGTLDTQDILLRNVPSPLGIPDEEMHANAGGPMDERGRVSDLCGLVVPWGVEGFIRMEAGFEIVFCNFTKGLDLVSSGRRPSMKSPESYDGVAHFEYVRAIASRYQGIGGSRVEVDYSSMVSAFFYPMNLSNPDAEKAYLPRLDAENTEQLSRIKSDIKDVCIQKERHSIINWQGIADMIVGRYSDRLQYLIFSGLSQRTVLSEINLLLNTFIDYSDLNIDASIQKCTYNYLPANPTTQSDKLIFSAIETVSYKICSTLFNIRSELLSSVSNSEEHNSNEEQFTSHIQDLITWLDWTSWKACGPCSYDEVCFVAVWPFGGVEDHFHPSCKNSSQIGATRGYWGGFGGPPRHDS